MRIAIIIGATADGKSDTNLRAVKRSLETAGHQVLAISVSIWDLLDDGPPICGLATPWATWGGFSTMHLDEIIAEVKRFGPSRILIEHDLFPRITGENVAQKLDFDKACFVGIDTKNPQEYCGQVFPSKGDLASEIDQVLGFLN